MLGKGMTIMASFEQTVRRRQACRDFLPEALPRDVIEAVLAEAQLSPSNCNTQPWHVHVVSGAKRAALSEALHVAHREGRLSPDFSWDEGAFFGRCEERRREQGKIYYDNLGVARGDQEGRARASAANFSFFGAPHVALLFMPVVGDSVRVAGDVGMYGQTFLLSLASRRLGGLPQTVIGLYADAVRDALDIPLEMKLLFAISFGFPDDQAAGNKRQVGRDPFSTNVTFHT